MKRLQYLSLSALPAAVALLVVAGDAAAHGGGLNAEGCHHIRETGDHHCHRPGGGGTAPPARFKSASGHGGAAFANCAAARAAGAAPVRRGDPGYARHLDRDNDGVGCER